MIGEAKAHAVLALDRRIDVEDAIRGRQSIDTAEPLRLAADMVESAVVREIRRLLRAPEIVARTLSAVRRELLATTEQDVVAAIDQFHGLWSALFPAEQARIVRLLVERITVTADGLAVDLRTDGIGTVVHEMLALTPKQAAE